MQVCKGNLAFFSALASETRLSIIELLSVKSMNLREMANELGVSVTIVGKHIKLLEAQKIVKCENLPGTHGLQRLCTLSMYGQILNFRTSTLPENMVVYDYEIGHYIDWQANPTCGLSSCEHIIGEMDDLRYFADPEHMSAQMIWLTDGYLEYVFPNYMTTRQQIASVKFQMEICSEAPDTNENWPSDIYFHVNGHCLGHWTSPGEFGSRAGLLMPNWWCYGAQHGVLKTITINEFGSYVDGNKISDINIAELKMAYGHPIRFRISAPAETKNPGGFTLFGRGFGNYDQGIKVTIEYRDTERS